MDGWRWRSSHICVSKAQIENGPSWCSNKGTAAWTSNGRRCVFFDTYGYIDRQIGTDSSMLSLTLFNPNNNNIFSVDRRNERKNVEIQWSPIRLLLALFMRDFYYMSKWILIMMKRRQSLTKHLCRPFLFFALWFGEKQAICPRSSKVLASFLFALKKIFAVEFKFMQIHRFWGWLCSLCFWFCFEQSQRDQSVTCYHNNLIDDRLRSKKIIFLLFLYFILCHQIFFP